MLSARGATLRLLAALVGFGMVAAAIVLAVEWQRGSARAVAEAARALDGRADDVAEHVARDVQERTRAVRAWVALDVAQEIAVDDVDKRLAGTLRELARDLGAADLAIALDEGGHVVAASDATMIGTRAAARFPGVDTVAGSTTLRDSSGAPWFVTALGVQRHDGRRIGALVLLAPWDRLVTSGLAEGTLTRLRLDASGATIFRGLDAGGTGSQDEAFVVGRAQREPVPGLALEITLVAPRAEVLAPVRAARRTAVLAAAAVLLALLPAALLLTRSGARILARQESLATMGTMAAGLAHEIRTPLGVVRTSLDLLERGGDAARRAEVSAIVHEETARLERLVEDLLAFARPRTPTRLDADLAEVVRRAEPLLGPICSRHGAALVLALEPARARVDTEQVRQVVLNLVDNAARFAGRDGRVTVSTVAARDGAQLDVTDTGPGVPATLRDTLWDPFVTSRSTGTGLGLAIVRRIVDAHGGLAEIVPSDGGAHFRITFPSS